MISRNHKISQFINSQCFFNRIRNASLSSTIGTSVMPTKSNFRPQTESECMESNKLVIANQFDKTKYVFVSRIQLATNPGVVGRLRAVTKNIIWDEKTLGCWIKKNSTAHSLVCLLGVEPYDFQLLPDGTYDRNGKVK